MQQHELPAALSNSGTFTVYTQKATDYLLGRPTYVGTLKLFLCRIPGVNSLISLLFKLFGVLLGFLVRFQPFPINSWT